MGIEISRLTIEEEDGSPSTRPYKLKVTNGKLTNNGDGTSSLNVAGVTDHGGLTGLADDDHTQYLLASGTRALSGAWDMGNQVLTNVNIDSGEYIGKVLDWNKVVTTEGTTGTHSTPQALATADTLSFTLSAAATVEFVCYCSWDVANIGHGATIAVFDGTTTTTLDTVISTNGVNFFSPFASAASFSLNSGSHTYSLRYSSTNAAQQARFRNRVFKAVIVP